MNTLPEMPVNIDLCEARSEKSALPALEKFAATDLTPLREDLGQSGLESWQAAELIASFLGSRGYGVSNESARAAAIRIESAGRSLRCTREELEKLALVM